MNSAVKYEFINISSLRFDIKGLKINSEVDLDIKTKFKRVKNLKSLRE